MIASILNLIPLFLLIPIIILFVGIILLIIFTGKIETIPDPQDLQSILDNRQNLIRERLKKI